MILSFIVAATAGLYQVGWAQQRTARSYSEAQTELRTALRRTTRALRHGYQVVGTSSAGTFSGMSSGPTQAILQVPDPGGMSQSEMRFYRGADGNLYGQGQADTGPGVLLIKGVQSVTFNYCRTGIDPVTGQLVAHEPSDSTPQDATEIMVTLTAVRGPATTTVKTYTTLRNALSGT